MSEEKVLAKAIALELLETKVDELIEATLSAEEYSKVEQAFSRWSSKLSESNYLTIDVDENNRFCFTLEKTCTKFLWFVKGESKVTLVRVINDPYLFGTIDLTYDEQTFVQSELERLAEKYKLYNDGLKRRQEELRVRQANLNKERLEWYP